MTAHGEVWLARLDKVRPVIVLTRDPVAQLLDAVLVVPITSTVRGIASEVAVGPADDGRRPSIASLDNVQLVERDRFLRRVGHAHSSTMEAICESMHYTIGC